MAKVGYKNKLVELVNKHFRIIMIAVAVIILFLAYITIIGPKIAQIQDQGIFDYNAKKNELSSRQTYLERLKIMKEEYERINTQDILKISEILPEEEDISGIFVQLEALAKDSGLKLIKITINKTARSVREGATGITTGSSGIRTLEVSISVSGGEDYGNLKSFLDKIEKNIRLLDVQTVSFVPKQNYVLMMQTYYLSQL